MCGFSDAWAAGVLWMMAGAAVEQPTGIQVAHVGVAGS